jgi:hypothetical protein
MKTLVVFMYSTILLCLPSQKPTNLDIVLSQRFQVLQKNRFLWGFTVPIQVDRFFAVPGNPCSGNDSQPLFKHNHKSMLSLCRIFDLDSTTDNLILTCFMVLTKDCRYFYLSFMNQFFLLILLSFPVLHNSTTQLSSCEPNCVSSIVRQKEISQNIGWKLMEL